MHRNMYNLLQTFLNSSKTDKDDIRKRIYNLTAQQVEQLFSELHEGNLTLETFETNTYNTHEDEIYCNGSLQNIASSYKNIHGYVSLAVCVFGTIANILNLAVLTRKDLRTAPINRILTALALTDMLVMIEYVPFTCYFYLVFPDAKNFPYSWAAFMLFHAHFSQVLHTISICLTLSLAVWRYIAIRHPQYSVSWCTDSRCTVAIATSYILPIFVCTPSYFVTNIKKLIINENGTNVTLYHLDVTDVANGNNMLLAKISFWMFAVLIKLLPCVILTVLSCCLIQTLNKVNKRKQVLKGYNTCKTSEPVIGEKRISKQEKRADRTTKMLVAILILFLVTEFPQGILALGLSGILGSHYFRHCYAVFAEVMDILALINGAINFILYCFMSRQFRTTFEQLFKPQVLTKWVPRTSQTDVHSTYV